MSKSEFLRKPSKEKSYFLGATMKVNVLSHMKAAPPHTKQAHKSVRNTAVP